MYSVGMWVLLLAAFVWLGILTFIQFRNRNFLSKLFPKEGERDIRKKFEEVTKRVRSFDLDLEALKSKVMEIDKDGRLHTQKVALLRYNPYDDTGGDQSFSIALLDSSGNGIVITSLHGRSETRVFAKPVLLAKATRLQLSKEEELVVKEALKR